MDQKTQKQPPKISGKLIGLVFVLLVSMPQLILILIPFAIVGGAAYLVIKAQQNSTGASGSAHTQRRSASYTRPAKSNFDKCPQSLFCFHKDKGEHHVARGKEIDPWDRPDIDIRKYQRKR